MKHTGTSHGRSEASGPNISNLPKNKSKVWTDCGRCKQPFNLEDLADHVWSTRHTYKGRKDNPTVSSSVTFHKVDDNSPVSLCFDCQKKTINEIANGGNWGS